MALRWLYHLLFPPGTTYHASMSSIFSPWFSACLRVAQSQEDHRQQRYLLRFHKRDGQQLLLAEYVVPVVAMRHLLMIAGSYNHFCFFEHISDSTKTIDDFAFFVFFTFKSQLSSRVTLEF
jgi:hypothetical protein